MPGSCESMVVIYAILGGQTLALFSFLGWLAWKDHKSDRESEQRIRDFEALIDDDFDPRIRKLLGL